VLGRVWTPEDEAIRDAVITCLSTQGERYATLSDTQHRIARELADGFGPLHPTRDTVQLWDWSNVRDSSPGGFRRIHEYLRVEGLLP
jgi:hypothetical protein